MEMVLVGIALYYYSCIQLTEIEGLTEIIHENPLKMNKSYENIRFITIYRFHIIVEVYFFYIITR